MPKYSAEQILTRLLEIRRAATAAVVEIFPRSLECSARSPPLLDGAASFKQIMS